MKASSSTRPRNSLHQHRIEKLLVVDPNGHCVGLITVKDIEKSQLNPARVQGCPGTFARRVPPPRVGEDGFANAPSG